MSNVQTMQIFSIINRIEQNIEESPRPKLGGNVKRVVDVDELYDLLGDLKVTIPEDIRRANTVLLEADTLINNATEHAEEIVIEAQDRAAATMQKAEVDAHATLQAAEREFERRVSEHEVLLEAQKRAELLAKKAEHNANVVYDGAKQYADDLLADLMRFLQEYQYLIGKNREELDVRERPLAPLMEPMLHRQPQSAYEEETAPPAPAPRSVPKRQVPPSVASAAAPLEEHFEEDETEEYVVRPQKRRWWPFGKRNEDDFMDDDFDDYEEYDEPEKKSWFRRSKDPELDIDLDEE